MKYVKKPVVIEAFLWGGKYIDKHGTTIIHDEEIPPWLKEARHRGYVRPTNLREGCVPDLIIETLEGDMKASCGDWIIKGVKGELYPCKPDIFEMTYEPYREETV